MQLILDQPRCEGHGLCEEAAPDLMHLDDAGDPKRRWGMPISMGITPLRTRMTTR